MKKYKWGILGPGSIARRFAEGLKHAPGAELYAVGSRDKGRAQKFASEFGFKKSCGSYEELVSDPDVDVVYVATPHPQHEEHTVLSLNHKKHTLCEKPFAVNAAQAGRMVKCAEDNGVFLMEGMWTRFFPTVVKARELIKGGAIGNVRHVSADFGFRTSVNAEGRLFAPAAAGGSLLDVGVYNVSFCSMVYGKQPVNIRSQLDIGETGVDERASALFGYDSGETAFVLSAIRLNTAHDAVIYGEDGYIKLPAYWHGDTVILSNKDGPREFKFPFESTGFQFEASAVMECLNKGLLECPAMPHAESLAIMGTLDEIRAAHGLRYPFE